MKDKKELAKQAGALALKMEIEHGCCPQCVLAAVQDTVGLINDETIKASHGLSGGGGLSGVGLCGSLVGGILALGAKRGRDRENFTKGKFIGNFSRANELSLEFKEKFGGLTCQELQHQFTGKTYDMWNPEEYQEFSDNRGDQCARTAEFVTRWVVEKL